MNNGITGDNDLNLALDVTAGQLNYSAITNSSTCFIVRAPLHLHACSHFCVSALMKQRAKRGLEKYALLVMCMADDLQRHHQL